MNNPFEKWEINEKTPNDLIFYKIATTYNKLKIYLKNINRSNSSFRNKI